MKNPFFNELTPLFLLFLAALGLQCCTRDFSSCREQRLPSRHSAWAACCDGFPCCGAQRLGARASPAAASGLSSCGTVSPRHVGSSRTRSSMCPLHWQTDSHPLYHQGSPVISIFNVLRNLHTVSLSDGTCLHSYQQ